MKQSFYLLFCLVLTLSIGCKPDDDDAQGQGQACIPGDLAGIRCVLSQSSWKIASVRSDIERSNSAVSTTDWLAFQPSCYEDVTITIPGFLESQDETILADFQMTGDVGSCDNRYLFSLESADLLKTANVIYLEPFALYMFGDTLPRFDSVSELWYDINFTEETFDFTVDKVLDSIDYRVDVRLVRSR